MSWTQPQTETPYDVQRVVDESIQTSYDLFLQLIWLERSDLTGSVLSTYQNLVSTRSQVLQGIEDDLAARNFQSLGIGG